MHKNTTSQAMSAAEINNAFLEVDGELPESLIGACETICKEFSIPPVELAAKWDALKFATRCKSDEVTSEQLDGIRTKIKEELEKQKARQSRGSLTHKAKVKKEVYNKTSILDKLVASDPFTATFGVPLEQTSPSDKENRKRFRENNGDTTPVTRKRISILSPSAEPSPPSKAFENRDDQGEILISLNGTEVARASAPEKRDIKRRVEVEVINTWDSSEKFRYMFEDDDDKREVINQRIEAIMREIAKANPPTPAVKTEVKKEADSTEEGEDAETEELVYAPVGVPNQESVVVGGMICGDESGKVGTTSAYIGGDLTVSGGHRTKLRLGLLKQYALFPGQVVGLKGINNTGNGMVVEEVLQPSILPKSSLPLETVQKMNENLDGQPLSIMVCKGPFTSSENLSFAPLSEMVKKVQEEKPDVLLLMGPFLSHNHTEIQSGKLKLTYQQFFLDLLHNVLENTEELATKILVVPSPDDAQSENVFPQGAMSLASEKQLQDHPRLFMLSNPCTFRVNDVTIGLTNHDVLLNLGKVELGVAQKGPCLLQPTSSFACTTDTHSHTHFVDPCARA